MKHLLLGFITLALVLSACSREEVVTDLNATDKNMLESFEIKRNSDGSYALTHEIIEGVAVDYSATKIQNEIYFYSDVDAEKHSITQNYNVENNTLNFVFLDENNSKLPRVSILDDNTVEKGGDLGLLDTYSLVFNQDGTAQLDFKVETGVDVAFGYNEAENINDIYLTEGSSTQLNYTQTYNKEADGSLRIDFVQTADKANETKKPRVIID